jgi:arylsulfatase A-like enzyme
MMKDEGLFRIIKVRASSFGREHGRCEMQQLLIAALILVLSPALSLASEAPQPGNPPNVLLITIDTLRADHLSCYGYPRQTSPNLDRLASQGVRFENAYSAIPLTGPSHITMMTGLFPQQHGATVNGAHIGTEMRTKRSPVMLAEVLHRLLKYRTGAFVSAWPLKKGITGLGRGFETYNQKLEYHYNLLSAARNATDVGELSRKWLRKRTRHEPFFLWVHYFDPHGPYELHPEFANLPSPIAGGVPSTGDEAEDARIRAYDSEIAFTDNDIGKTLKLLDEQGIRQSTLIYVVADHGEALGEHGYVGHRGHVYQPIVHVPMIISYPTLLPQGQTIAQDVSLVDLMPTVLDYVGIKVNLPIAGSSLRPVIERKGGAAAATQPAFFLTYSEPLLHLPRWITWIWSWVGSKRTPSRLGFVKGNVKVIARGGDSVEVLQLRNQFQVESALKDDVPSAEVRRYREYLTAWFKRTNTGLPVENQLTDQDKDMLRSLGYVP